MRPHTSFLSPAGVVYFLLHSLLFLLGFLLVQSGGAMRGAVGTSLMATAVAGMVVFVYIRFSDRRARQLRILDEFGVVDAFDSRSLTIREEYDKRLRSASSKIDIMGFGLRALRQDYKNDLEMWSQRAKVRILLLDPEFPSAKLSYAKQRDREEGEDEGTIEDDVRKFLEDLAPLISERFQVRLYRCLPSINIFRVDNEAFWGPYLVGQQSRNLPTFVVRKGGVLFDRVEKQFDLIWQDDQLSRPLATK